MRDSRDHRATIEAWRACGADRVAPVRFHYIDALQRRAVALDGEARQRLEARLAALVRDYADAVERSGRRKRPTDTARDDRSPLGDVLDLLALRTRADEAASESGPAPGLPLPPRMDALARAQATWAEVRTRRQVKQSREQTAEGAGPLNSARLVHRALGMMEACSPAYLERFLAYVDALSWLEQMQQHGALAGNTPAVPASARAKPPRKPRAARAKPDPADGEAPTPVQMAFE